MSPAPTTQPITQAMRLALREHAELCKALGIPAVVLATRGSHGTEVTTATHNRVFRGFGPKTTWEGEFTAKHRVWWLHLSFIRGEQRPEEADPGIVGSTSEQCQMPSLDVDGQLITVEPEDFIIDPAGKYFRVLNPVWSVDRSVITFMSSEQR